LRSAAREITGEDFMIQAQTRGCGRLRLLTHHLLPNLAPVLASQLWMSIPIFILSEANLGFLGLGVAELLPSWGNLLAGLQNMDAVMSCPWRLAPLVLLLVVMACFHLIVPMEDLSK
jgi:ABC-type dipeptide/oligopeptide/nickel transport system permease subunit